MEHHRCHKAYIPKTRSEEISDTVEFFPQKSNMPKIPSTDATIHVAQYLIYMLNNPEPAIPLVKLENSNKESFRSLSEIFEPATPSVVPPRVPVRGAYQ